MDRFEYIDARLFDGENYLKRDKNVKIYDGDDKTQFVDGEVVLTSHRILWGKPGDIPKGNVCLSLYLYYVFCIEEESGGVFGFGGPKRIILHLGPALPGKRPGPAVVSLYHYIKLSFKDGVDAVFYKALSDAVAKKEWESPTQLTSLTILSPNTSPRPSITPVNSKIRSGIVGIERSIEEQHRATDESINVAFKDLTKLMEKAKEMVSISKNISSKIREKQGDISEDDTVRFKSYLMSLGIDDPVTRDAFRSDSDYYMNLALQISDMMVAVLIDCGGIMSLADVWCRVNRARGLELVSPEDLLNACKLLERVDAPMSLRKFPSGACVLQLNSHQDEEVAKSTSELLEEVGNLTPVKLSQLANVSVLLARERLFTTERLGLACRDESIEGLAFYPNLFLDNMT
ncbi:vacuolar protein-sorting-associated protein 36 [Pararge aegeria]|uniref:Vacuolar protein-sorting-associated protein 36 n=3 Tax=Pararge aegeria TaxID=116150 RepID=A0A8S4REH0_9NEOP|nr:vacuolar protein-sorting-associated protein 36 [Pararge aegeria]XP_039746281.1 vacuolar protein-sorting-associated protein 36 [Pararge aegeria]XP_039746282.1 vacuolar protein-sorting-associated protein 36 [Pararge aegeria]CAH2234175.1 jg9055 [Pararge aegeria aegeria]